MSIGDFVSYLAAMIAIVSFTIVGIMIWILLK